ncbi:MAG: Bax inhibitor-1/YccA family protein [Ktedonobacteraceae bacterium]|nr:Bax inhibitor-1/YccA family protein [Ktedonobacteraceae bacterium]
MYNFPRNNNPYGGNPYGRNPYGRGSNAFGSRFQYETLAPAYQGSQTSGLIGKVMGLLAFSFIFASIGALVGTQFVVGVGTYWVVAIAGLVVLIALNLLIQRSPINLILLYLFTFLEGMALGPIISIYTQSGLTQILGEAFVITALTSLSLAIYSWTTKRDFTRLGDYLFFGVILLLVAGIVGIFFHSTLFALVISVVGIAIFSGYVLFYIQRAKYMADTLPNAIGLTVSLFITVLNLFLYILQLLTILQGGGRRR